MAVKKSAALGFIFVTLLIDVIGFGIIIPVMPKLIETLTGEGLSGASWWSGWLTFAYAITQFFMAPVIGSLSDAYGRRPVLLSCLAAFCLDYIFLAWAPNIALLFVGRIIAGATGASMSTGAAYIADISTPEKRAQNFGMIGVAFGLGFIIGPGLGGALSHWGPRVPFLAAAGLTLLNFLYGLFVLPESLAPENRRPFELSRANPFGALNQLRKYPVISGLIFSLLLIYIANFAVQSTWAFFTMEKFKWTEQWVGYSLMFVGLMVALVQGGLIRIIMPKLGAKRSVIIGLALYAIGMALFAFAGKGWQMFVYLVPYCLGGICGPALQGIMSNQVPPTEQGELQGAMTSLVSLTMIFGPLMMTSIFTYFTKASAPVYFPGAPFLTGSLLLVPSIILAIISFKKTHAPASS
ncbi:TCR/Tet family MFS transporter [Chitinophaga sp. sic0106]|uniref:TCR/Tet family MFS transporter n=1 Tax=Chitinophaga sp. sic0106 TaxID=2854785 RepID=UPI001C496E61|nr:TCR/Tet family MFS transporter [Chitinophaga sp. sic0106]MBV7529912.1 TCR/Tet family MFS transporter [Chitinophaga sp. sic0106]